MDFFRIKEKTSKNGLTEIFPDFKVCRSKDIMVRSKSFYAIWDKEKGLWSTDEYDVQRLVDEKLWQYRDEMQGKSDNAIHLKLMSDYSSRSWAMFKSYIQHLSDNSIELDDKLAFANTEISKEDYISKRLPYALAPGSIDAYDEIVSTLYSKEERDKIEWAIGSIVAGDSKFIQKFLVFYGAPGTGKSTILNLIEKLFEGYYTTFEAKALGSNNNSFATEVFRSNPLVAIQHDGDLSRIEDNSKLNSIISHEYMTMNIKHKASYMARINAFLLMATNKPVKISDAQSGIIRRLIDVNPTGKKLPAKKFNSLVQQMNFELGAIANHCLEKYRKMGANYYNNYKPIDMMRQTDVFFNYVQEHYHMFKADDGVTLSRAYELYKQFCNDTNIEYKKPRYKFREELKNYFNEFHDITRIDGKQVRSYYSGFRETKVSRKETTIKNEEMHSLTFKYSESVIDKMYPEQPAQLAVKDGNIFRPKSKWDNNKMKLKDIDTSELHYLKLPLHHIVIDFDIPDETGKKSLDKNIEAASKWPATYAELSRSGAGVHLHYIYEGDPEKLASLYAEHIEVKVFKGNSSLRRKLSKCNNLPVSTINSGLPIREVKKKVLNQQNVKSEKALVALIKKNLNKEIHPGTKPSMDFIKKILDDAYESGLVYNVEFMRPAILQFASGSTNQKTYCINLIMQMQFKSVAESDNQEMPDDAPLTFYDIEVFPNLFVIVFKHRNGSKVAMINPSPNEVEDLLKFKLIGFNNRRYDNHIIYAAYLGYNNEQLYKLSKKIINNSRNALFREAYGLSYADLYELSSKKQGLKKWQIELGIHHQELHIPWDEPVPEELWPKVVEYCENDVDSTEAVFDAIQHDWVARKILAKLSGLSMNDKTQNHAARILFGRDRNPQDKFEYTDLSEMFPGYEYSFGKSTYRDIEVGEGGYVYSEPGIYENVVLLDIKSMHPNSGINLNIFGPYTKRFEELVLARVAVKEHRIDDAMKMLDGILTEFLQGDNVDLDALAYALKIIINIVYGMTSAPYANPFKDPRNVDNIVAKRGALFMVNLQHEVQKRGYTVAHIKTDSIKIPNADQEIIDFVFKYGEEYGYEFDHEATYEKMALVNKSVYIAKYGWSQKKKQIGKWTPTGAQFAEPYVFKTLFSGEEIEFDDLKQTKSVTSEMYLDFNEGLRDDEHRYEFVGKVGSFVPIEPGSGGGLLMRFKDDKYYSVGGTKGYRWMEAEHIIALNRQGIVDMSYYDTLVNKAIKEINKFGDAEAFIGNK